MRSLLPTGLSAAFVLAFASPAAAQDLVQARTACNDMSNTYSLDAQIAGCTALIQAATLGSDDRAIAYYNRGIEYDQKGDYVRAIADYGEAIRLRPNYPQAFYNRGIDYRKTKDDVRALADYDQAIRLRPNFASAFNNRGQLYSDRGDNDRAIADLGEAVRLDPAEYHAFDNRGIAWFRKGDYVRALADFNEALRLKERPDFFYDRGVTELRLGRTAEGRADIAKATQADPNVAAEEAAYGIRP